MTAAGSVLLFVFIIFLLLKRFPNAQRRADLKAFKMSASVSAPKTGPFKCACCEYPTLTEKGMFEICSLCQWEDDGFNTDGAMGPNHMPLPYAKQNFQAHLDKYDATDQRHLSQNKESVRKLKLDIIQLYQQLAQSQDVGRTTELEAALKRLDDALFLEIYGSRKA